MNDILKYQELDLEIQKIESDILENDSRKNAIKMQQYLKDCQSKLIGLNDKAKEVSDEFNKYKEIYNQMAQNLELISKNMDAKDEKKLDGVIEANDAIANNLVKLERKLNGIINDCKNIQNDYNAIMKNARNAKSNLQKYKEDFDKVKQESTLKVDEKKAELEKLGKTVDKSLLSKYKQKKTEKPNVFVPEIKGRCGGCRMEISVSKLAKLKADQMIECENCGRIIYIK